MIRFMKRMAPRLHRGFRREDGTATIEFVLTVPVLLTIFMASFESGLLMVRSIMLEQSVDMTMRELRLGHYMAPSSDQLKEEICSRTVIFRDCEDQIMIEMRRINTGSWSMPATQVTCIDRDEEVQPVTALQIGQQNDVMLVRVCVIQDAMFPTTGIGLGLAVDSEGGYALTSTTAFVTEPS